MRYFFRLADNIRVLHMMASIARQPELWNQDNCRREFENTPHMAADDILLRFGSKDGDGLEACDTPAMSKVTGAKEEALNIMRVVGGTRLGRVLVTRLEPGKKILPHKDTEGDYAKYYTRYHLVLQGFPGSLFTCGDETVNMVTGDLWWFSASDEHSVVNNSRDDRVHMLIDVRIDP